MAATILHNNGWQVNFPMGVESYDLIARDPSDGVLKRIQVKTCKIRKDRNNSIVIRGAKSNGVPYSMDEAALIVGVHGTHIYLIPNEEQSEYSACNPANARGRWRTLTLDIDGPVEWPAASPGVAADA